MTSLRFRYQTFEFGNTDLHVRSLRDSQEYFDQDAVAENLGISSANWSLFGVIWPSGQVLAQEMFLHNIEGKRILEVGCGIGLASLLLNQRHANITATDYHPQAEFFLDENSKLNHAKKIPFVRTGWADPMTNLGLFDLIIGSDILYERDHSEMLAQFIHQHAAPHCEIFLVDPGRGNHAHFSKKMVALGYAHQQRKPITGEYLATPFGGQLLSYSR